MHSVAGSHFMAAVLKQIYLDDVSGFEPAFPFWWHTSLASVGPAQTADQGLPQDTQPTRFSLFFFKHALTAKKTDVLM